MTEMKFPIDQIEIPEILFPKRDLIFRRIFGVEQNKNLLKSFIQAVLNLEKDEISDLTLRDPQLLPSHIDEKLDELKKVL